jgi:hypothetical protein
VEFEYTWHTLMDGGGGNGDGGGGQVGLYSVLCALYSVLCTLYWHDAVCVLILVWFVCALSHALLLLPPLRFAP